MSRRSSRSVRSVRSIIEATHRSRRIYINSTLESSSRRSLSTSLVVIPSRRAATSTSSRRPISSVGGQRRFRSGTTTPTVARVLVEQLFMRFGVPKWILTDLGAQFQAQLFMEMCKRF